MMQPTIFNAALALTMMLGLIGAIAYVVRRVGIVPWLDRTGVPRRAGSGRMFLQLDKGRRLSIVELDGRRFAVLTGGRSDQLVVLDTPAHEETI